MNFIQQAQGKSTAYIYQPLQLISFLNAAHTLMTNKLNDEQEIEN